MRPDLCDNISPVIEIEVERSVLLKKFQRITAIVIFFFFSRLQIYRFLKVTFYVRTHI